MARISDGILPAGSQLGLNLDRYAELMNLDGCAFNGINRPTDQHDNQCIDIVRQNQRDSLAMYLMQSEELREEELNYHVGRKWRTEEHDVTWGNPFALDRKWLIEVGFPTYADISMGVTLDHGTSPGAINDPVVITVATTVAVGEIIVTYPDEDVRIYPTSVTASGGVVTIQIPRCRLVKPEHNGNLDDPPSYVTNSVFLETVDVRRQYADVSEGAKFVWRQAPCDTDCVPNCQPACPIITGGSAYALSLVHLYPATYSGSAWTTGCFTYRTVPTSVQVSYRSGRTSMSTQIYTIRLAHTLMPRPPCSCDIVKQKWEDDRKPQDGWSPYGNMIGAVHTWMADSRAKVGNGGMFTRPGGWSP